MPSWASVIDSIPLGRRVSVTFFTSTSAAAAAAAAANDSKGEVGAAHTEQVTGQITRRLGKSLVLVRLDNKLGTVEIGATANEPIPSHRLISIEEIPHNSVSTTLNNNNKAKRPRSSEDEEEEEMVTGENYFVANALGINAADANKNCNFEGNNKNGDSGLVEKDVGERNDERKATDPTDDRRDMKILRKEDEHWKVNSDCTPAAVLGSFAEKLAVLKEKGVSDVFSMSPSEMANRFTKIIKIGEGTFGEVFIAKDTTTSQAVTLKKSKILLAHDRGLHNPIVRELMVLRSAKHPNLLPLLDAIFTTDGCCYLVFPVLSHDLSGLQRWWRYEGRPTKAQGAVSSMARRIPLAEIKAIFIQIMKGVGYMHACGMVHRDIKPSNVLLHHTGIVQLCDFGWSRLIPPENPIMMTGPPCTTNYRPPECLLEWTVKRRPVGLGHYSDSLDIWCCGCLLFELITHQLLFQGKDDVDVMSSVIDVLGLPPAVGKWGGKLADLGIVVSRFRQAPKLAAVCREFNLDEGAGDLLKGMVTWDPEKRLTAAEVLAHRWLTVDEPRPCSPRELTLPPTNTYRYLF